MNNIESNYNEDKKKICDRLSRIEGQVKGIKKMVEFDRECNDILIQLQAVNKSVKSLSNLILEKHTYNCFAKEFENIDVAKLSEIIDMFKRFQ